MLSGKKLTTLVLAGLMSVTIGLGVSAKLPVTQNPVASPTAPTAETNKKAIDLNTANIAALNVGTQKGIAKATALAGLHSIDMNDGDKLSFAVSAGSYKDESVIAAGAFYRPNRNIMLSFASTLENEDQAYNVGLSFKFGKEGKVEEKTTDIEQLYKLIGELQAKLAQQQAEIDALRK